MSSPSTAVPGLEAPASPSPGPRTDPPAAGPRKTDVDASPDRTHPGRSIGQSLLGLPLFYKILLANALALALLAGGGAWLAYRLGAGGSATPPWAVAGLVAAGGLAVAAAFNAVVLRLALAPLHDLERTAARAQAATPAASVRVPRHPLADRSLGRLVDLFNGMLDRMDRYRSRLRELAVQALETAEGERRRVAHHLQDDTAQRLASLLIRIQLVRRAGEEAERDRLLEELRREAVETLDAVRRVARGLHPPELDEIGVDRAVRAFVRGVQESGGPEMELDLAPVEDCLDGQARLALYRIVQEAVLNVHRHADAGRAAVRIARRDDQVVAEVTDDGVGFRPEAEFRDGSDPSLGLLGMRERALYVGGDLQVMSRPGAGTRVRVRIPCGAPPPAGTGS